MENGIRIVRAMHTAISRLTGRYYGPERLLRLKPKVIEDNIVSLRVLIGKVYFKRPNTNTLTNAIFTFYNIENHVGPLNSVGFIRVQASPASAFDIVCNG